MKTLSVIKFHTGNKWAFLLLAGCVMAVSCGPSPEPVASAKTESLPIQSQPPPRKPDIPATFQSEARNNPSPILKFSETVQAASLPKENTKTLHSGQIELSDATPPQYTEPSPSSPKTKTGSLVSPGPVVDQDPVPSAVQELPANIESETKAD